MKRLEIAKKCTSKNTGAQPWFVVDKEGLRKTLERKGKAFAIYELLQNGYDENSTKVEVTLTERNLYGRRVRPNGAGPDS